ncbi:MAG: hypothetical protein Q4C47_03710, partial [Planctomycetia bacterium]|nr:hypothetical protein [Planctomycetia bacterium]
LVKSGRYYCVTSSRRIAERFLEACDGRESLADSVDFLKIRHQYPTDGGEAAFVFMSRAFLRNLASPEYRIELSRRVRAIADQEMLLLACLAGETEGLALPVSGETTMKDAAGKSRSVADPEPVLEKLRENRFLPELFGQREDGSRLLLTKEGVVLDSDRGLRGAFTPIPDMTIADVSETEYEEYRAFAADFGRQWSRMRPGVVVFRRMPLETAGDYYSEWATAVDTETKSTEIERIVVDAQISFLSEKYTQPFLEILGPELTNEITFDPGERVTFDVSLPRNRLFGAIREPGGTAEMLRTGVIPFRYLPEMMIGWFGYQGEAGLLATIYDHLAFPPDANGLRRGLLGLWSGAYEAFHLYSFQPELIPEVASGLQFVESPWPAQLRLRIRDPRNDRSLTELIQVLSQGRAIRATAGNLRLLNQISLQFRISPEESLRIAESLLDAELVDPFGGKYVRSDDGYYWVTTDWASVLAGETTDVPLLEWFRGMRLDGLVDGRGITVHLETAMRLPENLRQVSLENTDETVTPEEMVGMEATEEESETETEKTGRTAEEDVSEDVESPEETNGGEPSVEDLLD